ncbi:cupin domain-containing protein [Halohasta salina]|uniref:cupin domain-containing protein n=1 Tax=Halohasta salina TaxID=2961621 RepID=UPI0020A6159F|nr:cupin domain-containing protein [Halohasta salina]
MSYTKVDTDEVEPVADGLHMLREPLESEQLGVSLLSCEPGWEGKPHDHADEGQEEVYVLVEGAAVVTVDDEKVPLTAGDALRVDPESTRQIHNGDEESLFVLAGAS